MIQKPASSSLKLLKITGFSLMLNLLLNPPSLLYANHPAHFAKAIVNTHETVNLHSDITVPGSHFVNNGIFNVNHLGTITRASGSTFHNTGTLTINSGGTFSGHSTSLTNTGHFILKPSGKFNASSSTHNSLINNGTMSLYGGHLNAPLTSSISNPVLNIMGSFANTHSIHHHSTINVANASTIFTIQSPITGLSNLHMATNTTTMLSPGGSITAQKLFLTNAGTLMMSGGHLSAEVIGTPASTFHVAKVHTTSGPITNVGTIYVSGGNFTINHPITGYSHFKNSATVIMNGGTISGGIQGNGPGSHLIINKDFTTNGILGEGISLDNITINPGATLHLRHQANVSGNTFTNTGNMSLTTLQTINGPYVQTGTLTTTLLNNNAGNYGQLYVVGPATVGGQINILLLDNGNQINNLDTFDIITASSLTDNNPSITAPNTINLSFARDRTAPSNIYRIIANRTYFNTFINNNPSLVGLAGTLDNIRSTSNSTSQSILSQLSTQPNQAALIASMTSLLPNDINGAHITTGLITQDILLEKITNRLDAQRRALKRILKMEGYTAGDFRELFEPGVYGFVNHIKQERRDNIDGYGVYTGGVGLLADVPIDCWTKIGFAINYASSAVKTDTTGNRSYINNYQGTFYGSYEYGYGFIDGLLSIASNEYNLHRKIAFLNQTASARYYGNQSNGKIRAGLDLIFDIFQFMPMASIGYTHLNQNQYTEKGTTAILTVGNHRTHALEAAYGLQISFCKSDIIVPEIHAMGLHFIKNPNVVLTSRFTNAGPAFLAVGPSLPKNGVNFGAGFTGFFTQFLSISGRYDLELRGRHNLMSNSLSIKFRYLF